MLRFDGPSVPEGFSLRWNGAYGWRIERDGVLVREGFASQLEATLWLRADRGMDDALALADPPAAEKSAPGLSVQFIPRNQTWRIRDADGMVVEGGFASKEEAEARLGELVSA